MIALTSPYFWYTTRATAMVTLLLFTAVATLGMLVANRVGGTFVGRFELNELHRSISIVAMVFLVLHIATTVLDSFVSTGWISAIIPFASHYRTSAVAVGAVAFDLMIAVWVTSMMKTRIKNSTWRAIHWFGYTAFAAAIVHAYMTGTDAKGGIGLLLVLGCGGIFVAASIWRYFTRPTRAAGRTALSPLASAPAPNAPRAARADVATGRPVGRPLGQRPPARPAQPAPERPARRSPQAPVAARPASRAPRPSADAPLTRAPRTGRPDAAGPANPSSGEIFPHRPSDRRRKGR